MPGWLIAAIVSVFALMFAGFFVTLLRVVMKARSTTRVRVEATVIRHERRHAIDRGDPDTFAAVYRFIAANGRTHEVEDRWSSVPARYKVGERVTVEHPIGEPQLAAPPRLALWMLGVVVAGGFALAFIIAAALAWMLALG